MALILLKERQESIMKFLSFMLGTGLLKKEKKKTESKLCMSDKESVRLRKRVSVELFLRHTLGTRLIEKKF